MRQKVAAKQIALQGIFAEYVLSFETGDTGKV